MMDTLLWVIETVAAALAAVVFGALLVLALLLIHNHMGACT